MHFIAQHVTLLDSENERLHTPMTKALIVLSGGQDSTTCLYWAIKKWGKDNIVALSFNYGQRHKIELECATKIANDADIPHRIMPINTFESFADNALTNTDIDVSNTLDSDTQLPNTFVPGRNLIFLTFAAAYAYTLNIKHIVTGVAQTDYSGYPDCRENTLDALEKAINLGMESDMQLHTPLMFMSKADTVQLAKEVDALDALAYSHTCYNGEQPPCGECASCQLRAKGFAEANTPDPLIERFKNP